MSADKFSTSVGNCFLSLVGWWDFLSLFAIHCIFAFVVRKQENWQLFEVQCFPVNFLVCFGLVVSEVGLSPRDPSLIPADFSGED